MKILVITNLFPNNKEPNRGVFNRQQVAELAKLCEVEVVAPVAWHRARGIAEEEPLILTLSPEGRGNKGEGDLTVYHPRYFMVPKIGRALYGFFFYLGIIRKVREIYKTFKFDMILATWAYPDGFGAALVSNALKKPLVIKVHGSDVNITSEYFLRRKMMVYAFKRAQKIIAVSSALKQKITELGIPGRKIEVITNGVDTGLFKPMDKIECRKKLNLPLDKKIILFVGNLEKVKGIDLLVEAMRGLPEDVYLVVVGKGSLKNTLMSNSRHCERVKRTKQSYEIASLAFGLLAMTKEKSLTMAHEMEDRIWFFGARPHDEIPVWMNAADVFCLPSRNEGCPNVILEALACGTPIAASNAGGIPELIKSKEFGILVSTEDSNALEQGINRCLASGRDKNKSRDSVLNMSWQKNAEQIFNLLNG